MTFAYRNRKKLILGGICIVVLCLISYFTVPFFLKEKEETVSLTWNENKSKKEETRSKQKEQKDEEIVMVQVDIKGAVQAPGIYSIPEGSRVIDVIRLAGDLTENADTSVLNLSKKVFDEMVIIVYTREEVENFKETKTLETVVHQKCEEGLNELKNDACQTEEKKDQLMQKISLNQATKEELMTLSGIGEAKADEIIAYRNAHGGFKTIEELKEVPGIGEALFSQIQENITL